MLCQVAGRCFESQAGVKGCSGGQGSERTLAALARACKPRGGCAHENAVDRYVLPERREAQLLCSSDDVMVTWAVLSSKLCISVFAHFAI